MTVPSFIDQVAQLFAGLKIPVEFNHILAGYSTRAIILTGRVFVRMSFKTNPLHNSWNARSRSGASVDT